MDSGQNCQDDSAGSSHTERTIAEFDTLIVKAAVRASLYINGTRNLADDLAQDLRWHLARVLETREVADHVAIRQFIRNALRDRIRFEKSRIQLCSTAVSDVGDPKFTLKFEDTGTRLEVLCVRSWIASVPSRLCAVFDLLYRHEYSQREAATILGMSQASLNRVHQDLIARGRLGLAALAA